MSDAGAASRARGLLHLRSVPAKSFAPTKLRAVVQSTVTPYTHAYRLRDAGVERIARLARQSRAEAIAHRAARTAEAVMRGPAAVGVRPDRSERLPTRREAHL